MNSPKIFIPRARQVEAAEVDALRIKHGLSYVDLATMLEVSPASVQSWCEGKNGGRPHIPRPVWKLFRILIWAQENNVELC